MTDDKIKRCDSLRSDTAATLSPLKKYFDSEGLRGLDMLRLLELVLSYSERDPYSASKRLCGKYHDLPSLLLAGYPELKKYCGESSALLLSSLPSLFRYVSLEESSDESGISGIAKTLSRRFFGRIGESAILVTLSDGDKAAGYHELGRGSFDNVAADIRCIAEFCVSDGCLSYIIAHNHPPSGSERDTEPSARDMSATEYLRSTSAELGLTLAEHIIISGGRCRMLLSGETRDFDIADRTDYKQGKEMLPE